MLAGLRTTEGVMQKQERKEWAEEDHLEKAHREALGENGKRDWVQEAAERDLCQQCGEGPASRCREAQSCREAVAALHARQRQQERDEGWPNADSPWLLSDERRAWLGL